MEPRPGRAEEVAPTTEVSSRTGVRITAGCVLLIGLALIQSPGLLVSDTKFDLAVDPAGFLGRALHLWDGAGAFGQLQNQAYGYLWPMGPFFLLGGLLDFPGWVVQRLWTALVMCVAFVGTARLARGLGVRSDAACLIAAFAYALSPRMLTTLGPISIEAWPSAVAPWMLLALVRGSKDRSPYRMALLAGLAVATVGGVNAAATLAILPLGVIWLLTQTSGPRRRVLMLWWPVFTAIGTLWWVVPLLVLGAYSPPFLDFIETASITTFPTTLFDALRGTSDWVPYVDGSWRGGNETVTQGYLALNSGIVLMLGLLGMMWRGNPHRVFLVCSLLVGLLLVRMGHVGSVQGWIAAPLHDLLDGALAPFRNVHKFDPIVRLPLVLGVAFFIDGLRGARGAMLSFVGGRQVSAHAAVATLAAIGVLGASVPAVSTHLAPTDPVFATPGYWHETVDWLDESSDGSTALLVPGSGFAQYVWGSPRDEPMQYLSDSPWAVRNAIPLAPAGNIRMLDAIEERLTRGEASAGLAAFLGRAGVRYLVVRNDLAPSPNVADATLVHQAIDNSPQIRLVQTFGPEVGSGTYIKTDQGRLMVNGGWQDLRPAIEIYEVTALAAPAVSVDRFPVVVGGPEDLLDLTDLGVIQDQPTRLAVDVPDDGAVPGALVLTDGLVQRERFFGRAHDGYSSATTPGDRTRSGNPTPDYVLGEGDRWMTRAQLVGAERLSASSSMSDSNAVGGVRQGELPFAAVDGDTQTQWVSGNGVEGQAWWRIDLASARSVRDVEITLGEAARGRGTLRVENDSGDSAVIELEPGDTKTVALGGAPTRWLRIEDAAAVSGQLVLAEVAIEGLEVTRPLVLPEVPASWGPPDQVVLRTLRDHRTGCVVIGERTPCLEDRVKPSEEPGGFDRVVSIPDSAVYAGRLTVRPRGGEELFALLQTDQPLNATGSSVGVPDARASGLAALDGDLGTSWTPRGSDLRPRLALNWIGKRWISGIALQVDDSAPVRRPTTVVVTWPGGRTKVSLDDQGRGELPRFRTDRLVVEVTQAENAATVSPSGVTSSLPPGIGEIRLTGLPLAPLTLDPVVREWPCGTGPTLEVNGVRTPTSVTASAAELYEMTAVEATPCAADGRVVLDAGENTVRASSSAAFIPDAWVLGEDIPIAGVTAAEVESSGPAVRRVSPQGGSVLVMRHNANPGWTATQDGETLEPLVVDGWQQAWFTTGSDSAVETRFAPDRWYGGSLVLGGILLLLLALLSLFPAARWPGRRLPGLAPRRLPAVVLVGGGVLAAGLLGGVPGLVCAVVGLLAGAATVRWLDEAGMWLIAALVGVASFGYFLRPWGDPEGWAGAWTWPHYLVLVALSGVVAVVADLRSESLRRRKGSSTTR